MFKLNTLGVLEGRAVLAVCAAFWLTVSGCAASADETADPSGAELAQADSALEKLQRAPEASACSVADKTTVKSASSEYTEAARILQPTCKWDPCHCYIDGLETSCSLVAACLRSTLCQLVRQ
jgi:hypothetical protein